MNQPCLEIYGLLSVVLMILFYTLESRHNHFTLLFSVACLNSALYAFLSGSYPFALAELFWSGLAIGKWTKLREL